MASYLSKAREERLKQDILTVVDFSWIKWSSSSVKPSKTGVSFRNIGKSIEYIGVEKIAFLAYCD